MPLGGIKSCGIKGTLRNSLTSTGAWRRDLRGCHLTVDAKEHAPATAAHHTWLPFCRTALNRTGSNARMTPDRKGGKVQEWADVNIVTSG